jgi:hypothetical protein
VIKTVVDLRLQGRIHRLKTEIGDAPPSIGIPRVQEARNTWPVNKQRQPNKRKRKRKRIQEQKQEQRQVRKRKPVLSFP